MKKVAVILSGCGVLDGAEIHESVLTLLRLAEQGAAYQCLAPNIPQMHVVNHLTGEVAAGESRNVLVESARIARGDILDLASADADDYAALLMPGGFGAAKNLSDFAVKGADMSVQDDVLRFARRMHEAGKPIGLMCISPALAARIFGEGVACTIGTDQQTAAVLEAMGARHVGCAVGDVVIDRERRLVTTPAYMLAASLVEAASGIRRLVDEVLAMAG